MATFLAGEQSVRERAEAAHGAGKVQLLEMVCFCFFFFWGGGGWYIAVQLNISNYKYLNNYTAYYMQRLVQM